MAELNCLTGSGAILYSSEGNYGTDGSGGGYGGGGGMGGGGSVWSDSEQTMWISANNAPKYPVYLKPGWNKVHFWIPFIFPDDEWVDAPITIETPGYILIPAGFEFNIKTDKKAPVEPGNPKMIDKLQFVDVWDYDIQNVPVPVNLDGLLEELVFEDTHSIDIIAISNIVDKSCIDNLTIEDINDYDIQNVPVPVNLDALIDELVFEDTHSIDIIAISNIVDKSCIDNLTIEDINDYEIQGAPFSGEYKHVDNITFNDVTKTELINITILNSSQLESENIGFEDFVKIEKT